MSKVIVFGNAVAAFNCGWQAVAWTFFGYQLSTLDIGFLFFYAVLGTIGGLFLSIDQMVRQP